MAKKLTPKEKAFVNSKRAGATNKDAAIAAGYSKKTARTIGSKLLTKVDVASAIETAARNDAEKAGITATYVLSKIKETIEKCSQAEQVMEFDYAAKEMVPTGEWKFEHMGVLKGLELLGRHLKLFTDKVEHSGKVTLEQLVGGSFEAGDKND